MDRDIGVWIDHRQAVIVTINGVGPPEAQIIESGAESKHKSTGHVRASSGLHRTTGGHKHEENKRRQVLAKYYDRVISRLAAAERLLIVGPNGARLELEARMSRRPALAKRILGRAQSGRVTQRQLVANVRRYFEGKPRPRRAAAVRGE